MEPRTTCDYPLVASCQRAVAESYFIMGIPVGKVNSAYVDSFGERVP